MINFLWENSVSILIILISWLSISQLMICNICFVVWHELIDILQCFDYILILILESVQKSRQILLSWRQIKILSRHERWELNLLNCKIILLLKLILWIIILSKFILILLKFILILLKFFHLQIEKLISLLFYKRIMLKLKWWLFHILILFESVSCWEKKRSTVTWWTENEHETFIIHLSIRKWRWVKAKLTTISIWDSR